MNVYNQNQDCMQIPVEDNENAELYLYFDTVADKINDILSKNGKLMIYCKEGKSRSASLCIAYLVKGPFINYVDSFLASRLHHLLTGLLQKLMQSRLSTYA